MVAACRSACLFLLTALPLSAAPKAWVEPKVSAVKIAAKPGAGAYENKPQPVSIPAIHGKVTVLEDGRRSTVIGKSPWTLELVFTEAAWTYKLARDQAHDPAVYHGEVMKNPATGQYRLILSRGLTYAASKPAR